MTILPIAFGPEVINEWMGTKMGTKMFFLGPESNDVQYDQLWPDLTCDPKLDRGQILLLLFFFCKIEYHSILLNDRNTIVPNSLL